MRITAITKELVDLGDAQIAAGSQRYFKTGKGDYGDGDRFRGIRVPVLRRLARTHQDLTLDEALQLLHSAYHEDRLLALLILCGLFFRGDAVLQEQVYDLYRSNTQYINNWDLVDSSAAEIVGAFLWDKNRRVLEHLARSNSLWERRISIIATFYFIKRGDFRDTIKVAELLLSDQEDLIHKAAGWMLREVGNRDQKVEEEFLRRHYRQMPRVMLRYAIEKFPQPMREGYLKGQV